MHIERIIPLDDEVFKREKLVARKPRRILTFNGPKGRKPKEPGGKYSDEILLEIRRLFEVEKLSDCEITEHLNERGLMIAKSSVNGIRNYSYRSLLVPEETDIPYWPKKT